MAQVVDADADIIEYKLASFPSNGVHDLYFIQFVNGRKTEFRKCIRCSAGIKAPKSGTSALHKHKDICCKREIALQVQSPIPFKKTKTGTHKGLDEVAKLVYDDRMSINAIVNSSMLNKFFRKMNFSNVSYHAINNALESEGSAEIGRSNGIKNQS